MQINNNHRHHQIYLSTSPLSSSSSSSPKLLHNHHNYHHHHQYLNSSSLSSSSTSSIIGRELMSAAQSELTIGNLVRRVLFFIREEYANQIKLESNAIIGNNNSGSGLMSPSSGSNSPGSIVPSVTAGQ